MALADSGAVTGTFTAQAAAPRSALAAMAPHACSRTCTDDALTAEVSVATGSALTRAAPAVAYVTAASFGAIGTAQGPDACSRE